jgi:hypothetical protein
MRLALFDWIRRMGPSQATHRNPSAGRADTRLEPAPARRTDPPPIDPALVPRPLDAADRSLIDRELVPSLLLSGGHHDAVKAMLRSGKTCPIDSIPPAILLGYARALPPEMTRLVTVEPFYGLGFNPFDFAQLEKLSEDERASLTRYLDRGFPRLGVEEKKEVLRGIERLLVPDATRFLERFHLPRSFGPDSGKKPITSSIESEAHLSQRPELLYYYAPDPKGGLDRRALSDELLATLFPGLELVAPDRHAAWIRMTPDQQRESLRWRDLSLAGRVAYLEAYEDQVDPKVKLHRIEDPAVAELRDVAPSSMSKQLHWEGAPLTVAEIMTESYYDSLDQLFADIEFVEGISPGPTGYHIHNVVELSSPEDVKRLAPAIAGIAGMIDLFLFTIAAARGGDIFDSTHLEVWKGGDLNEVAASFADGVVDHDKIIVHKFHLAGLRVGLYGEGNKIGIELRGIPAEASGLVRFFVHGLSDMLAEGHLEKLPAPPWPSWDAGDPSLPVRAYEAARADPKLARAAKGAEIEFAAILEIAAGATKDRDAFKYAAPLWSFESLPGVTPEDKQRIETARERYTVGLLGVSRSLTTALKGQRAYDDKFVKQAVSRLLRRFFVEAGLEPVLGRTLMNLRAGKAP